MSVKDTLGHALHPLVAAMQPNALTQTAAVPAGVDTDVKLEAVDEVCSFYLLTCICLCMHQLHSEPDRVQLYCSCVSASSYTAVHQLIMHQLSDCPCSFCKAACEWYKLEECMQPCLKPLSVHPIFAT